MSESKGKIKTLIDEIGFVYIEDERVFRIIKDKVHANIYRELIETGSLDILIKKGLIETWISKENCIYQGHLLLEHLKIPFILNPAEYTNHMFFDLVKTMVNLNRELASKGLGLKDAHPWNMTYFHQRPVFFDFCSIVKRDKISSSWINEFIKHCALPILLAHRKSTVHLSLEIRKEHDGGFGKALFDKIWIKRLFLRKIYGLSRYASNPIKFLTKLLEWLDRHKPVEPDHEYWSKYEQEEGANFAEPKTLKQKAVYSFLKSSSPRTVIDFASNRGFYSLMAANMGAEVASFDYEEFCVDQCMENAIKYNLPVTAGMLNFNYPTPTFGLGLLEEGAFARLKAEVALSLGLIHHICIVQKIPVKIFCEICKSFAKNGIILEFVERSDIHVQKWHHNIPEDYNLIDISNYMKDKFPRVKYSERITDEGVDRIIAYYHH